MFLCSPDLLKSLSGYKHYQQEIHGGLEPHYVYPVGLLVELGEDGRADCCGLVLEVATGALGPNKYWLTVTAAVDAEPAAFADRFTASGATIGRYALTNLPLGVPLTANTSQLLTDAVETCLRAVYKDETVYVEHQVRHL